MGVLKKNKKRRVNRRKRTISQKLGDFSRWGGRLFGRVVPWVVSLVLVLSIPAALVFIWDSADQLPMFQVDRVDIEGNVHTTRAQILEAVRYTGPETNIFSIEPVDCEARLEELPWVTKAHVERGLPSRVKVRIEERSVGGLVLMDRLYLADESGVPFKPVEREVDLDQAVVTGTFGPLPADLTPEDYDRIHAAFALMTMYYDRGLDRFDRLSEVHVDALTGFALVTERRRIRVLLGEDRMNVRLARLGQVFEEIERRGIAARTIRLDGERLLDRVAVERDGPRKD